MVVTALVMPATVVGWLMVARGNSVIGLGYTYYLLPAALALWLLYDGLRLLLHAVGNEVLTSARRVAARTRAPTGDSAP
jgi:hypothetical protein